MRKIIILIGMVLLLSCSKDDSIGDLIITVDEVTDHTAKISWSINGAETAVFEITLNGNVLSNGLSINQYTFTNLNQLQEYNGVIFARTPDKGETFASFSFRTLEDRYKEGNMYIGGQAGMDNFNFITIEGNLTLNGENITDLSNLSSLKEVGSISILRTSLTNLNGLHNVERFTNGEGSIRFLLNSDLSDVSALSNLSGSISQLRLELNPSLFDLRPLGIADGGELKIRNSPLNDLSLISYGDHINLIELQYLPNFNSLNGLQELPRLGRLKIQYVPNLEDLNALSELDELRKLEFRDLEQFSDLSGLTNISISETVSLIDLPSLSSLNGLQATTRLGALHLIQLPLLINLEGLNNLTDIGLELQQFGEYRAFSLRVLNISSLQGLDNLTAVRDINIWDCDLLTSLDGSQITTNGNLEFARWLVINRNSSLSDFCGLTNFVNNSDFDIFQVQNNLYNPQETQIGSTTECSQ